jgi:hypothetical protein
MGRKLRNDIATVQQGLEPWMIETHSRKSALFLLFPDAGAKQWLALSKAPLTTGTPKPFPGTSALSQPLACNIAWTVLFPYQ